MLWTCDRCGNQNGEAAFCGNCQWPRPEPRAPHGTVPGQGRPALQGEPTTWSTAPAGSSPVAPLGGMGWTGSSVAEGPAVAAPDPAAGAVRSGSAALYIGIGVAVVFAAFLGAIAATVARRSQPPVATDVAQPRDEGGRSDGGRRPTTTPLSTASGAVATAPVTPTTSSPPAPSSVAPTTQSVTTFDPPTTPPPPPPPVPVFEGIRGSVYGTCNEGGSCGLRQRSAPYTSAGRLVAHDLADGESVVVMCQVGGDLRTSDGRSSSTWFRLDNGAYVPSVFLDLPDAPPPC